ncbi:casein kinase ii subunit beta-2 [Trichoderma arundinaceum]|uniref:Casein kinase ii subunit beta-2 n=1 Tax=Trichoderma arundinaceum TaxID=490622 RepID=A0A395NYL0_TRIAR|nr:casein kinase ii subunit beta-2 [Trichoderma arundinaceum]
MTEQVVLPSGSNEAKPVSSRTGFVPGTFHLSPLGERNLLWAACSKNGSGSHIEDDYSQPSLSRFVRDIFDHSGISVMDVVTKYLELAYHWLPTLDRDAVYGEAAYFSSDESISHDSFALLLLCMHMFAESPCQHQSQLAQSALYQTARQLFVILQSSAGTSALTLLQCGIIMTTYACGHGLSREAYETLTICIGLIRRLSIDGYTAPELKNDSNGNHCSQLELDLCWSGIILLDRTVVLSEIDRCLPYLVEANHLPPSSAIFQVSKADLYGRDAIRNLLARAEHAIRIGDLLKAIRGSDADKYEAVETEIYTQISDYICTTQGGSFPLCETVAMSLR